VVFVAALAVLLDDPALLLAVCWRCGTQLILDCDSTALLVRKLAHLKQVASIEQVCAFTLRVR
jgi:hypothetical protein